MRFVERFKRILGRVMACQKIEAGQFENRRV